MLLVAFAHARTRTQGHCNTALPLFRCPPLPHTTLSTFYVSTSNTIIVASLTFSIYLIIIKYITRCSCCLVLFSSPSFVSVSCCYLRRALCSAVCSRVAGRSKSIVCCPAREWKDCLLSNACVAVDARRQVGHWVLMYIS